MIGIYDMGKRMLARNIRVGQSETFLTEACEYTNSFLSFFPTIGIILNIDADHLDFFKDIDDIRHSFRKFAELLPADGALIINADTPKYEMITENLPCRVITYGLEHEAEYTVSDITYDEFGHASFHVLHDGKDLGVCSLKVPGIHNVSNALASIAAGQLLGLATEVIFDGLKGFTGTDRRFQYKGKIGDVTIIDDYAHHPTEIEATLHAAKNYPHKKLWCVFQPHTYSRTKAFLNDFADVLSMADVVVLADIYGAKYALREKYQDELSKLFNTNVVFVEYRYFLESCPEPKNWDYLTAENSVYTFKYRRYEDTGDPSGINDQSSQFRERKRRCWCF